MDSTSFRVGHHSTGGRKRQEKYIYSLKIAKNAPFYGAEKRFCRSGKTTQLRGQGGYPGKTEAGKTPPEGDVFPAAARVGVAALLENQFEKRG